MSVVGLGPIKPPELGSIGSIGSIESPHKPQKAEGDFGDMFANALQQARGDEHASTESAEKFAKGDPGMGIHEVMIASEKANISIRYATTLKNKALEAYRELMNTQV
jgi:flagellar hook-basal body complex protein FliE